MSIIDVAIIGFGGTGVGLLNAIKTEISRHNYTKPSIGIFNSSDSFSKGKAFGDSAACHLINTPINLMSTSSLNPEAFNKWLKNNDAEHIKFPSRMLFSNYLQSTYDEIRRSGILDISEFKVDVVDISKVDNLFELSLQSGNVVNARNVVMCLGALNARNFTSIRHCDGFIHHHSNYKSSNNLNILIAGSGLSAVDAFRHIEQKNINTSVSMFSRHGLAPMCISSNKQYEPKYVNWHSIVKQKNCSPLKAFMRVMAQEKKALEDKGELKHAINLLHAGKQLEYFEYIHSRACNGDLPWQDVLVSTRYWFYKLWKIMPSKEKHFFNKNYGHLWGSWRHPILLSVFSQLKNAVKQKRLKFYRSTAAPKYENNLFSVKTTQGQLSSHMFWDGTGGNFQLQHIDHPLIKNLLAKKYIEPHSCGGLRINPDTFTVKVRRKDINGLYNIGPLNKGALSSTNAFWFNLVCAERWAHNWINDFNPINNLKNNGEY